MGGFSLWGRRRGYDPYAPGGTPTFTGEPVYPNRFPDVMPPSFEDAISSVKQQDEGPAPQGTYANTPMGPAEPTRMEKMEDEMYMQDHPAPLSTRQKILRAVTMAAPMALGGIFGGVEGATGAGEGTIEERDYARAEQARRRGELMHQAEGERGRQERLREHEMTTSAQRDIAKQRTDELRDRYETINEIKRIAEENKAINQRMQNSIAQQRADAYSKSIDNLGNYRGLKAELEARDLDRKIAADENLDDRARQGLRQQLQIANQNLGQRKSEEEGRNTRFAQGEEGRNARFAQGEAGKTWRTQFTQGEISKRAAASGKSAASVQKSFRAAEEAAKRLPGFADMEPEQQSQTLDALFGSFLANEPPAVKAGEGAGRGPFGIFGSKPVTTVTRQPGAQVPGAAPPAGPPPGQQQAAPKVTTKAVVQQYASQNGVDYATAEGVFKSKGYTIQ